MTKVINIIGVDNNDNFRKHEKDLLLEIQKDEGIDFKISLFKEYDQSFFQELQHSENNILLLDIITKENDGIEVLRQIRQNDKRSLAIFVSGHEKTYGKKILKDTLDIYTFITKDINFDKEFKQKIKLALKERELNQFIQVYDEKNTATLIPIDTILYISTELRKMKITTNDDKVFYTNTPLHKLLKQLGTDFASCHRSCIINLRRVQRIDKTNRIIYFDNQNSTNCVSRDKIKKINELIPKIS